MKHYDKHKNLTVFLNLAENRENMLQFVSQVGSNVFACINVFGLAYYNLWSSTGTVSQNRDRKHFSRSTVHSTNDTLLTLTSSWRSFLGKKRKDIKLNTSKLRYFS